jgi:hypothetical protein
LRSLLNRESKWRCWKAFLFFAKNRLLQLGIRQIFTLGTLVTALSTRQISALYRLTVFQRVNKFPAFYAIPGFHECVQRSPPLVCVDSHTNRHTFVFIKGTRHERICGSGDIAPLILNLDSRWK